MRANTDCRFLTLAPCASNFADVALPWWILLYATATFGVTSTKQNTGVAIASPESFNTPLVMKLRTKFGTGPTTAARGPTTHDGALLFIHPTLGEPRQIWDDK